jgi:hypothetical protein
MKLMKVPVDGCRAESPIQDQRPVPLLAKYFTQALLTLIQILSQAFPESGANQQQPLAPLFGIDQSGNARRGGYFSPSSQITTGTTQCPDNPARSSLI